MWRLIDRIIWHRDEKIQMLSLSVINNTLFKSTSENKIGIINILVYSYVIDDNRRIELIFFLAIIITSGWRRFAKGASGVLVRLLQIFYEYIVRHLKLIYHQGVFVCTARPRLREVSYISLQSYCTRNLSTRAAKPPAARNEGVSPRRKNKRLLTLLFCLGTTKLLR